MSWQLEFTGYQLEAVFDHKENAGNLEVEDPFEEREIRVQDGLEVDPDRRNDDEVQTPTAKRSSDKEPTLGGELHGEYVKSVGIPRNANDGGLDNTAAQSGNFGGPHQNCPTMYGWAIYAKRPNINCPTGQKE
ncbi:hypothetical protein Hanom_Chr16g01502991 [Helianthus anomalus]